MKPPREWPQPGHKPFSELTSELTWHAMAQIVDGTPLKRVITEIMNATIEWKLADRAGENEPTAAEQIKDNHEQLAALRQERDTLVAALTASEADVETLNALTSRQDQKIQELEAENNDYSQKLGKDNAWVLDLEGALRMARERAESYYLENQELRTGQVAQAQDITKLRETLNEAMNSLSKERKRAEEAEKQRDHHLKVSVERYHANEKLLQENGELQHRLDTLREGMREIHDKADAYTAQ